MKVTVEKSYARFVGFGNCHSVRPFQFAGGYRSRTGHKFLFSQNQIEMWNFLCW